MFSGNYTPSVADIAAVTNGNCGNGYGYGGDWWGWIILQALNLGVSQRAQNDYLVSQLRPCPTPAFIVPNPFGCGNGNTCGNCC